MVIEHMPFSSCKYSSKMHSVCTRQHWYLLPSLCVLFVLFKSNTNKKETIMLEYGSDVKFAISSVDYGSTTFPTLQLSKSTLSGSTDTISLRVHNFYLISVEIRCSAYRIPKKSVTLSNLLVLVVTSCRRTVHCARCTYNAIRAAHQCETNQSSNQSLHPGQTSNLKEC